MSKERLESAKLMAKMLRLETRLPYDFPFDLADWLVEQAERVQELEEEIDRLNGALHYQLSQENIRNEENRKLKYKNKRYREAIERALDESGWGDEGNALHKMISILAKALEESE